GEAASTGIERIAEDGNAAELETALAGVDAVDQNGTVAVRLGETQPGPVTDGQTYVIELTPTMDGRFFSFATMVVPTNDTFIGTADGVALLDEAGAVRPAAMIQADLEAAIAIYDAGTEANEPGVIGPNQARIDGTGGAPDTGPSEGDGTVRPYDDFWGIPDLDALVRVTITPVE
ncbi:MAG: spondin domain-containing protein, partial [Myxococcota bacterium]